MTYSLNGTWYIDYLSNEPYTSEAMPSFQTNAKGFSDSVTEISVPSYFEDNLGTFRSTALHTKLKWNPMYTDLRYPHASYSPDMALANPVGCFLYKKSFVLDQIPQNTTVLLYVGGVQNTLSAWLNGHYLGRHEGYSCPFDFTVPSECVKSGENTITLAVSNTRLTGYMGRPISGLTSRAANECTGGIYGDVELRFLPMGLRDVWVSTSADLSAFTVKTVGAESAEKDVTIYHGGQKIAHTVIPKGQTEAKFDTKGYSLWSPEHPNLYTAEIGVGGETVRRRFGIRKMTSKDDRLYFNGEPYFFRGTCEHCYHPVTVHPTRDKKYYRQVIKTLKELGFNSIRFHTYIPMLEYMEAADELGMALEVETPNNTTYGEWEEIVRFCRRHPSVVAYSSGNEMLIDEAYIEHLRACAAFVHTESDSLFSPMSAMRGVEYFDYGDCRVNTPFPHNPKRLTELDSFCDLYNSYSLGLTSYSSEKADPDLMNVRNAIYKHPLLSHEICIHGTYCDLSLQSRYENTRIGQTALFSSVKEHLFDVGLLDRANLYYRHSSAWQALLRKHCFEALRRTDHFAGYDFLGDIDTHWHTFGYCVGMMNEFYELKPYESVQNVRRYNSDTVLLADLPHLPNLREGQSLDVPISVSHYAAELTKATLNITVKTRDSVLLRREIRISHVASGAITKLYTLRLTIPRMGVPQKLTLSVSLSGGHTDAENEWTLYTFPKASRLPSPSALKKSKLCLSDGMTKEELTDRLERGENILIFGSAPFVSVKSSFQLSIAGRTTGHLATVIDDHPALADFPHDGFCAWQFRNMLEDGNAIVLDDLKHPHTPIIDIATSYKNAHREAMLFEYRVGKGKLLVCGLKMNENDAGAAWLREKLIAYAMSENFAPTAELTMQELHMLCSLKTPYSGINVNEAQNQNDITMKV